ncbi:MAG: hypothetical protein AAF809_14305 [Bacteroidota bacterium]
MPVRLLHLLTLLLALPLLLFGCDTAEDEPAPQEDPMFVDALVQLDYLFDDTDFGPNGTATVPGNQSVFIDGLLSPNFSRRDIATVRGVEGSGVLSVDAPAGADIDQVVASAELRYGGLVVGQVTPNDSGALQVAATDLTSLLDEPSFESTLRITLDDPSQLQDYALRARVTLRFELEP